MDPFLTIGYSLLLLFILFLIIKQGVSAGIDSSKEIRLLKKEITDLKKQLKTESQYEQKNHLINKKV